MDFEYGPFRVYGGIKYYKVRHAILCCSCNETIESKEIHEFKTCGCGAVSIDGGLQGRVIGTSYEDRSMFCAFVGGKRLWLPLLK
jgi:predicted RNA-binding Zn-ribbon protein involved in translation (DUF1610 family)